MDKDIKKVEERLEYLGSDPKTIELYRAREKSLHERANLISSAKEEGRTEGIAEGIAKGRTEGIAKGRAEEKKELVKNLLLVGVTIEKIMQASGLNKTEIDQIKKQIH